MRMSDDLRPVRSADLTREVCPMTFVKLKLHLELIQPGEVLEVLLKEGEHMRDVPRSVKEEGHKIVAVEPVGENYRVFVQKAVCGGSGEVSKQ